LRRRYNIAAADALPAKDLFGAAAGGEVAAEPSSHAPPPPPPLAPARLVSVRMGVHVRIRSQPPGGGAPSILHPAVGLAF